MCSACSGDLGLGVGGQAVDLDVVLLGVGADPVEGGLAEGGQGLAQGQRILGCTGYRARVRHRPGAGVSRGVQGEGVGEGPGGGVAAGQRVAQVRRSTARKYSKSAVPYRPI